MVKGPQDKETLDSNLPLPVTTNQIPECKSSILCLNLTVNFEQCACDHQVRYMKLLYYTHT
jgi:hypothetical protein